jgi:hypothetical protein
MLQLQLITRTLDRCVNWLLWVLETDVHDGLDMFEEVEHVTRLDNLRAEIMNM